MTNTEQQTSTSPTSTGTVDGVPAGYTSLTPYLCVDGGDAAIGFYTSAFGATVISRMDGPDGTVAHAELDFGNGRLQLSDPVPDMGLVAPGGGGATHSIVHYCADVDATWRRAVAAGATPSNEPDTFVTGDRFGAVLDPFGHRWTIMTRVEDLPPAEAERRVQEWLASQA